MTETPQERARRLMGELDLRKGKSFTVGDVKLILNNIANMQQVGVLSEAEAEGSRAPTTCEHIRRGDVFVSKLVGGKLRPWVVLHVTGDMVSALALSTSAESTPVSFPSQCRFWPSSHICATVTCFNREFASREVTRPYTARAHLTEIERQVFATLAPKRKRKATVTRLHSVARASA